MNFKRLTLALGANLGDRHALLSWARAQVQSRIGPILHASRLHETKAWGLTEQPDFLNQVLLIDLTASPALSDLPATPISASLHALLSTCQHIEAHLGRQRHLHWGPRTCDLDLIFVDDLHYEDERLSLPHPWWQQRPFVGGILQQEFPYSGHRFQDGQRTK